MVHGPTRRLKRQLDAGIVDRQWYAAAVHEAGLLAHAYVGPEHLELARLRHAGAISDYAALSAKIGAGAGAGVSGRGWRPRGVRSALRSRGRLETLRAQRAARLRESETPDS